ncbi:MAG TPA: hypothetical protein VLJ59_00520 [Mycobacteriales bacterium]|nr:hypothetical protein [Mycobacteriales bacterium]
MRVLVGERDGEHTERAIQGGLQLRLTGGAIINVYNTGLIAFQGKETTLASTIAATLRAEGAQLAATGPVGRTVNSVPTDLIPEESREHNQISVEVPLIPQLSLAARMAFQNCVQRFADDLANESERLEQGRHHPPVGALLSQHTHQRKASRQTKPGRPPHLHLNANLQRHGELGSQPGPAPPPPKREATIRPRGNTSDLHRNGPVQTVRAN